VIPHERTVPLFDYSAIDILCVGHHDLIDSIEPDLIGQRDQLAPLPLGLLEPCFQLIGVLRTCHLPSGVLVARFSGKPEVFHVVLDELVEVVLKHQHALIAEDNDDVAIQGVICNLPQVIQDLLGRCHVLLRIVKDREGLVIDEDQAFV
jgi:hypothetical protein